MKLLTKSISVCSAICFLGSSQMAFADEYDDDAANAVVSILGSLSIPAPAQNFNVKMKNSNDCNIIVRKPAEEEKKKKEREQELKKVESRKLLAKLLANVFRFLANNKLQTDMTPQVFLQRTLMAIRQIGSTPKVFTSKNGVTSVTIPPSSPICDSLYTLWKTLCSKHRCYSLIANLTGPLNLNDVQIDAISDYYGITPLCNFAKVVGDFIASVYAYESGMDLEENIVRGCVDLKRTRGENSKSMCTVFIVVAPNQNYDRAINTCFGQVLDTTDPYQNLAECYNNSVLEILSEKGLNYTQSKNAFYTLVKGSMYQEVVKFLKDNAINKK